MGDLKRRLGSCTLCADRFAATATGHAPRPVVWFGGRARILIASQAPGLRVHEALRPFWDRSGQRLRDWLGMDEATFYDTSRVAIVPMAFCFPGYDAKGSDLPPPPGCARTWRDPILSRLSGLRLTVLIGGHAQRWHLGDAAKGGVTRTVAAWRDLPPDVIPLPHPSWRNTAWLKRNPWFESELLPVLRRRVAEALA
ncbi:uracil-DNA glycosylase family protein [Roseitranquillus sediminis]|uniref:uracil-DNA glycosylase family protein n=1 Tax=Roseitranquillus sediminis TaxID=2809051 RepID=UPI001D0C9873|nr:uracil-DNA glycosylase family protein [Roseitranquillus sediminis]MBM9594517.1 uracil-DNA glycosylase family protein [Roseitranquillus sediminis]